MTNTTERWICLEFYGKGDRFFGGDADDRVLGKAGAFLTGCYSMADRAIFQTKAAAEAAGSVATNARKGGKLLAIVPAPSAYE